MAPLRVIAVFDTRNDPSSRRRKGGIEVHFAASGDDEVVRLAESIVGTVVAVSNDREVRERPPPSVRSPSGQPPWPSGSAANRPHLGGAV